MCIFQLVTFDFSFSTKLLYILLVIHILLYTWLYAWLYIYNFFGILVESCNDHVISLIFPNLGLFSQMNERWLSKGGADVGNDNPFNSSIMREKTGNDTSKVTKLYQEATKPVSPPPQKRAQPKRTGSAWERDKLVHNSPAGERS